MSDPRNDVPGVPAAPPAAPARPGRALAGLALGALGVVYGDIGTSPLYSLKECFSGSHSVPPTQENVLGVLSLVIWSITFVVSFKYLAFVMRADNRGEGGILALLALVGSRGRRRGVLVAMGLFGAALLYGDGVITPAISVLSAVEGLAVAAPALHPLVVPVSVAVLVGLFLLQKRGTGAMGALFGPVMLIWFLVLLALGVRGLGQELSVLRAISPTFAASFFARHGWHGFLVLGAVVLVITGGEALYADLGHFGRRPIRLAWWLVVMPALLVNYLGQGAELLHDPAAASNPFFLLAPRWAVLPLVVLATVATVIASQALVSGAFSLTQQAVQLGYAPRLDIQHTSHAEIGQIYVPEVNAALGCACVALVLGFRSSSSLAAAYGIAVTGTMSVTTILFHQVARERWGWPRAGVWCLTVPVLAVDLAFLTANVVKFTDGGWFPIGAAAGIFTLMTTWKRGRELLAGLHKGVGLPLDLFMAELHRKDVLRVPGTAVFMTSEPDRVSPVLLHHLKHNKALHARVVLVTLAVEEVPIVPEAERVQVRELGRGFFQVLARRGFMETPDVPALLASLASRPAPAGAPLVLAPMETTYFLGRETILPTGPAPMARWRKRLFVALARNARTAGSFFGLPPNRVVELGAQVQL